MMNQINERRLALISINQARGLNNAELHELEQLTAFVDDYLEREHPLPRFDGEILTDGVTVWVNGAQGYCLGRFGRMGIDVHNPPAPGTEKRECLFCTHGEVTEKDWDVFVLKMILHHNVLVPVDKKPERFVCQCGHHSKHHEPARHWCAHQDKNGVQSCNCEKYTPAISPLPACARRRCTRKIPYGGEVFCSSSCAEIVRAGNDTTR